MRTDDLIDEAKRPSDPDGTRIGEFVGRMQAQDRRDVRLIEEAREAERLAARQAQRERRLTLVLAAVAALASVISATAAVSGLLKGCG